MKIAHCYRNRTLAAMILSLSFLVSLFCSQTMAAINGHYKGQGSGKFSSGWHGSCYFDAEMRLTTSEFQVIRGQNLCGQKTVKWPEKIFHISGNDLMDKNGVAVGTILSDSITVQLTDAGEANVSVVHLKKMPVGDQITVQYDEITSSGRNTFFGFLKIF